MRRFILSIVILMVAFSHPALAKQKGGKSAPGVPDEQGAQVGNFAENLTGPVLADAIRLCQLVVNDDPAIVDTLESEGWTHEIEYNVGNAPFYKELSGDFSYPGVGEAQIWGFIEDYPGNMLGYCSFTISDPLVRFSISAIDEIDNMVGEMDASGEEVYGAWRDAFDQPSVFIHAYHNLDTFTYQITRISKFSD